jgi:hypothetical protein
VGYGSEYEGYFERLFCEEVGRKQGAREAMRTLTGTLNGRQKGKIRCHLRPREQRVPFQIRTPLRTKLPSSLFDKFLLFLPLFCLALVAVDQAFCLYTSMMLPHSVKDNKSFHNFARQLLPLLGSPHYTPPRQVRKNRPHPKDFSGVLEDGKCSKKCNKKTSANAADSASIPDPVPDTGIATALAPPVGSTMIVLPPVSQALSAAEASLSSMTTVSMPTTTASMSPTLSPSTSNAFPSSAEAASVHHQTSQRLSTTTISLIAVGSAFALVGIFIVFKICNGPRKRIHLIPSNPILQEEDDYSEKYGGDESPLFGGKDRLSGANSGHTNSTLWPWTQYHSGILKPAPSVALAKTGTNVGGAVGYVASEHEKIQYPLAGLGVPSINQGNLLQPVQNAVTRVASRLSTISMSLYPNSPRDAHDVGLAIDGATYTADDLPVLKRTKSTPRRRSSAVGLDNTRVTAAYTRFSQGSTYNGVDIDSLPVASQSLPKISIAPATNNGGRARVKSSYYAPGAYPRASNPDSNLPSTNKKGNVNPFADSENQLGPLQRSGSRRDRDTRALTSALGLASPIPPSPQPTLYPDDSLSMAGEYSRAPAPPKNKVRDYVKPALKPSVARHRLSTPPIDSSATLGSLMLVDFGSGITTLKSVDESLANQDSHVILKRSGDKPPRVPSPPPLPSLTQMGLAHAHPEAYANYRSPTYSIYGLYEADRKSKTTSIGY